MPAATLPVPPPLAVTVPPVMLIALHEPSWPLPMPAQYSPPVAVTLAEPLMLMVPLTVPYSPLPMPAP